MQPAPSQVELPLPPKLKVLAALLGSALGCLAPPPMNIDAELVSMAIGRHQVGPLLYGALLRRAEPVPSDLMQDLALSYRRNRARQASSLVRLQSIGAMFAKKNIGWMSLKGVLQAAQLYGDPALRQSSDIDLLVAPWNFAPAVSALGEAGYTASNPPAPSGVAGACILAAVRDVTLIARDDHSCAIDLHRRLFLTGSARKQCPQLHPASGLLPAPYPDAELACYLLMHGAQSYWVRLKWLVDLIPLLARLKASEKRTLISRVEEMRTEHSVAASLLLLRHLFPSASLGPLSPWLDGLNHTRAVKRRLERYVQMIIIVKVWKCSPLDNARIATQAYMALFESPWMRARMIPVALLSCCARRTGGAVWREARKLTRGSVSPLDAAQTPAIPSSH